MYRDRVGVCFDLGNKNDVDVRFTNHKNKVASTSVSSVHHFSGSYGTSDIHPEIHDDMVGCTNTGNGR